MHHMDHYRNAFTDYLAREVQIKEPQNLYAPIIYILGLGGKRIRPVMTLMAADIFGEDYRRALDAALAIEVFHNFSLVHDDIMDAAPLRRGQEAVHKKWDINTGILSGDAMLICSYRFLERYNGLVFKDLVKLLGKTAIEVCEGQQYDVDFESRDVVTIPEYFKMIEYKTAVLLGAALQMGAIIAEVDKVAQDLIYEYGRNLGIAFQLQDDYLDAFGDPKTFGKQVGGDIIENKKTFLYLKARELASPQELRELDHLFSIAPLDPTDKINAVKNVFLNTGASEYAQSEIEGFTQRAFEKLEPLKISEAKKRILRKLGEGLMMRLI
ncbi:polyprenyl synthetase family protein [Flavobacteriaceae bacterium F89]|uniref:Polyprenyl synthetase family protein n=1 Tax=Cerina litoralis TaxID=2874477 RepID=A0AAE3ETB6_9FLAO|nr:polyprenyl synthetase family protein [Cerina litoralis]MCG2459186.1 polyprenyl synthetase family protein [Cerina litoralis]